MTASGVVFCGAGLCVASVVLDVTVCTRDAVERALGRLRETHIGARPHVAFMFTCVGRGASHYQGEVSRRCSWVKYHAQLAVSASYFTQCPKLVAVLQLVTQRKWN